MLACAAVAAVSVWPTARDVRTEDRIGDGRPDLWRVYDDHGQLVEVDIDTNCDGRSDVREDYEHGQLVRRELDRDFNDQVDLVEDFDPDTHEETRAVVDVDYSGTADLLVLFQGGQAVFSKWTHPVEDDAHLSAGAPPTPRSAVAGRAGHDRLASMDDPFRTDTAFSRARVLAGSDVCVGLSTAGGLPEPGVGTPRSTASSRLTVRKLQRVSLSPLFPRSPRGPPVSLS